MTIPTVKASDPPQWWTDGNGRRWKVCACMAVTLPLVEAEMRTRGLIKRCIDVFQGGYNAGGVTLSAGTHDGGGVIDTAQGITLAQREVWAMCGVMMFPRTRQWGWMTGDHGHGVWRGCPHQSRGAAQQVVSGLAGRDGLVSNIRRNWVAPQRTWQDAARALAPTPPAVSPAPSQPILEEDPVPAHREIRTKLQHPGRGEWCLMDGSIIQAKDRPQRASVTAQLTAPSGITGEARLASWDGKAKRWVRYSPVPFTNGSCLLSLQLGQGGPEADLRVDVHMDQPCEVSGLMSALSWEVK